MLLGVRVEQGHFFMFSHGFSPLLTVQCGCVYVCIFITHRDVGVWCVRELQIPLEKGILGVYMEVYGMVYEYVINGLGGFATGCKC